VIVEPERGSVTVADLRVAGAGRRRVAVVDGADQTHAIARLQLRAHERRSHRIVGAARRQNGGRHAGKPEARIEVKATVGGGHHLVIRALLPDPERSPVRQFLFEPQIVEFDARRRLDVADNLQVADMAARWPMAMEVKSRDEEFCAGPANHLVKIDIELGDGQSVIAEALPPAP
jgi:hypothetical protein